MKNAKMNHHFKWSVIVPDATVGIRMNLIKIQYTQWLTTRSDQTSIRVIIPLLNLKFIHPFKNKI